MEPEMSGVFSDEVQGFADVEAFVAEHQGFDDNIGEEGHDVYPEGDVAEILATTWKEKRAELSRLNRSRRFAEAKETRRSFRVEIEELKKRTKCNRCGRFGHWARECEQPRDSGSAASSTAGGKGKGKELGASFVVDSSSQPSEVGASFVEPEESHLHFVASVFREASMLQRLASMTASSCLAVEHEALLVSSPGFGVLDSGCGKAIVGAQTLEKFHQLWRDKGISSPKVIKQEINVFKFGNGHREVSEISLAMPVGIGGRRGTISAAVVRGDASLLISRPAMKTLQANLNFERDSLTLFADQLEVPVQLNAAGQYAVNVMDFPLSKEEMTEGHDQVTPMILGPPCPALHDSPIETLSLPPLNSEKSASSQGFSLARSAVSH